ncbi:hypothetical protein [Vibrio parahaemolyticus]|uniref:Type IV pilus biogenesis protein PilP n=1 Tax=Vibrio parahaemolyticus TaxID=670 RepID=A0AAX1G080_VIBPH|nr:hypothetical protein [Vibrio parahaemolyticus]QLK49712.1 hypothetical protein DR996_32530 [Vibrio owensii]MDG3394183.1 hypothetical protein [Vibrio parahaemolyticus]OUD67502.1 hypothetical protein BTN34_21975 [Vibrio parahaemolyticus]OUD68424.1 hypothetical protein BTN60_21455 [Vibrio parahaemolyticus]QHH13183.1 hypothetical protein EHC69_28390 [Vibrio parahaemolyticus]
MKITKAHVQVTILIAGGIAAAATWVAPKLSAGSDSTPPAQISVPAKQGQGATKATVANVVAKKPKPNKREAVEIAVDEHTKQLVVRGENLAIAKIDTLIAAEKSRTRKAKNDGKKDTASTLDAQLGLSYTPSSSTALDDAKPAAPKPAIDRFTLRGLSIDGAQSSAYLAFDAGQPFLVKAGQTVKGVRVTNINANGVRLTQGTRARVLDGGL